MPPRLAIVGTFDVDNFGDHLFPRVAAAEIGRRLPGATVDAYAPFGPLHPCPLDDPAWPVATLPPWTEHEALAFAAAYDTVLVGGGEIIHLNDALLAPLYGSTAAELARRAPSRWFVEGLGGGRRERRCPVVWNGVGVPDDLGPESAERVRSALEGRPYVAVRDRFSRARLERAGVGAAVDLVPDSAFLLDRALPAWSLRRRRSRLRAAGCYPAGPALVVQGGDLLEPYVGEVAAALRRWLARQPAPPAVVLLETGRGRGDGRFADRLARCLAPLRPWRMPDRSDVADIAAAVAGATAFVGSSLHGAITATVYGRPFVTLNLAGEPKLDAYADLLGLPGRSRSSLDGLAAALDSALAAPVPAGTVVALQRRVDAHFDRVAALAAAAAAERGQSPRRARAILNPTP